MLVTRQMLIKRILTPAFTEPKGFFSLTKPAARQELEFFHGITSLLYNITEKLIKFINQILIYFRISKSVSVPDF